MKLVRTWVLSLAVLAALSPAIVSGQRRCDSLGIGESQKVMVEMLDGHGADVKGRFSGSDATGVTLFKGKRHRTIPWSHIRRIKPCRGISGFFAGLGIGALGLTAAAFTDGNAGQESVDTMVSGFGGAANTVKHSRRDVYYDISDEKHECPPEQPLPQRAGEKDRERSPSTGA